MKLVQLAYAASHCKWYVHISRKAVMQMIHALACNDSILLMLVVVGHQHLCMSAPACMSRKRGVDSPSCTLNVHA